MSTLEDVNIEIQDSLDAVLEDLDEVESIMQMIYAISVRICRTDDATTISRADRLAIAISWLCEGYVRVSEQWSKAHGGE